MATFKDTNELLDYIGYQQAEIRAESLCARAFAGAALQLLLKNSPDRKNDFKFVRERVLRNVRAHDFVETDEAQFPHSDYVTKTVLKRSEETLEMLAQALDSK